MAKTIFGFTYDEEDFNYFIIDNETWNKKELSEQEELELSSCYDYNCMTYEGDYTDGSYVEITDEFKVDDEHWDIWWNLSEPVSKEMYWEFYDNATYDYEDFYYRYAPKLLMEKEGISWKEAKKKVEAQRKETARMLKTIGQLMLERDFLQDCFRRTGRSIPEFDPDKL